MNFTFRTKLLILIIAVSIFPMVFLFSVQHNNTYNIIENEVFSNLESIVELKIIAINQIIDELNSIILIMQYDHAIRTNLQKLSENYGSSSQELMDIRKIIDSEIKPFIDSKKNIKEIFLIDTNGIIIYASDELNQNILGERLYHPDDQFLNKNVDRFVTDVFYDDSVQDDVRKYFIGKVFDLNDEHIGFVVLDVNMSVFFDFIEDRTGLGNTGETLIGKKIGNEAVFINNLRHYPDASFNLKIGLDEIRAQPIRDSVQGISGSGHVLDYRSEPIIAVWKHVPVVDWGIVGKIDTTEAFSSINETLNFFIILFGIVLGAVISTVILASTQIVKPIKKLDSATKEIVKGNLDLEVIDSSATKELSSLANSFSKMVEKLKISNKEITDLKNSLNQIALVSITDRNGNIIYVNDKFCEVSKYSREELLGKNHRILKSGLHPPEFYSVLMGTISNGKIWKNDIQNKAKDGSYYWVKTIIVPIFNMKGKIEKYFSIRIDITKNKKDQDIIKSQLDEIKHVEKLKEEFIAMISHELKTPITPIVMWTDTLKNPKLVGELTEIQREAVDTIAESAHNLKNLVSDIFDSYKLDLNSLAFNVQKIEVEEIMNEVNRLSKPHAIAKEITIENSTIEIGTMYSDHKRIVQVLVNLINNAIDFVEPKTGKIEINASVDGDNILFYVKDNGKGIPKEKQSELFKKFYQVDTSTTREHGGSGLGLSICKGIVEGLGGKIWVESEIEKGATFYFSIPKGAPKKEDTNTLELPTTN